ncbi:uncharacterized protein MONOS_14949 [Monocercomonoides exilis]|uniref:uncharacterized protein n=1 Tax=Monocercomonoides exilis TaxID=2049356 RepID=UPI00355AC93D|nr:hypothetical protein MONOS_14949 [Monocercomonoides exilis]|eukprot:MONOS_14949.1-p1 / transcript=MONOS_14949.1 / gene=MONOS_14949 / organism=Monocercomonoides_exilis_PA203 / gene_product=unspecified product / transcript_product=unspecified product / location=Mono_scaffold01113:2551-3647(+) / protein_length=331 / sequence_SO=supercontig / SO=protein_coding / is_pseudo=false
MYVLVHITTDNLGVSLLKMSEYSEMTGALMMAQGRDYKWFCEISSEWAKAKTEMKTRRSTLQTNRNDEGKGTLGESNEAPQNEKAASSGGKSVHSEKVSEALLKANVALLLMDLTQKEKDAFKYERKDCIRFQVLIHVHPKSFSHLPYLTLSIITFIHIMRSMGANIEGLPNDQTEDEENNNQQDGNEEVYRHYHKDESREEGVGVGVGEGGEGVFEEGAFEDKIEEERQIGRERHGEEERAKRRSKEAVGNEDGFRIEIKPQQQPHKEVEYKEEKKMRLVLKALLFCGPAIFTIYNTTYSLSTRKLSRVEFFSCGRSVSNSFRDTTQVV